VAHALVNLPKISAAMESGGLSYSKVREITRVAKPENEDYLLMIAEGFGKHGPAAIPATTRRRISSSASPDMCARRRSWKSGPPRTSEKSAFGRRSLSNGDAM
jgi:hypothetical protein